MDYILPVSLIIVGVGMIWGDRTVVVVGALGLIVSGILMIAGKV